MTDRAAGRRIARRLGLQVAALIVALLAVVGLLAVTLYERAEHDAAERALREAAAVSTVADAPPGFWVVQEDIRGRKASAGLPDGLPDEEDLVAVLADGRARQHELEVGEDTYFLRTERRGATVVQVAMDRTEAEHASARLVTAVLWAGALGVALSAALATVLARRSIGPVTEALDMQRRFVADASHELRTPVTLLSTRVQLLARKLRREGRLPSDLESDLAGVLDDARALGGILDDLLVAADPGMLGARTSCDLAVLARSCVQAALASAEERGLRLVAGHDDAAVVLGSEAGLRRAVTALVDNALDHAASTVRVDVVVSGRVAEVVVSDDGPGIPPEAAGRIFERFASARPEPTVSPARSGRRHYGLGLALVADVAAAHAGRVELRRPSDPGGGASIALVLPRARG